MDLNLKYIFEISGAILLSIGSATAIMFGLSSWLGKVWANRILASESAQHSKIIAKLQEQLREKSEKSIYIHKVQFEKEYLIYEKVWKELVEVQAKVRALRPMHDSIDLSETDETRKKRRLKEAGIALENFCKEVELHRPFYVEEVYKKLNNLIKICVTECVQYRLYDPREDHQGYWEKQQENATKILQIIDEICISIRERIQIVKIA